MTETGTLVEMRELDSRPMDIDSGRFEVSLWWDSERERLFLIAIADEAERARVRVQPDEAGAALRHPAIYLRDFV